MLIFFVKYQGTGKCLSPCQMASKQMLSKKKAGVSVCEIRCSIPELVLEAPSQRKISTSPDLLAMLFMK